MVWRSLEGDFIIPEHIENASGIFYAREYIPKKSRSPDAPFGGESEDLITNFKKPTERRNNPNEWIWKTRAITKFAQELSSLLGADSAVNIVAMPSSKKAADLDYDARLIDVLNYAKNNYCPKIEIFSPLERTTSCSPLHLEGLRNPTSIQKGI